jgi:hypothetical protein
MFSYVYVYVYLPTCLPAYLPTCLPAYLPTCLPFALRLPYILSLARLVCVFHKMHTYVSMCLVDFLLSLTDRGGGGGSGRTRRERKHS